MTNTDIRQFEGVFRLVIATAICLLGCSKDQVPDAAKPVRTRIRQEEAKPSLALEPVLVPVTNTMSTYIGFRRSSPPPWEEGNYLTLRFRRPQAARQKEEWASWVVANINSENFVAITRKLKIDVVEVLVLHTTKLPMTIQEANRSQYTALEDAGYALITDPRIPREWLLSEPSRYGNQSQKFGRQLKTAYPKNFRAID